MAPQPQLAGHLVQQDPPDQHKEVYLVDDDGRRRWIPNPQTRTNLFGNYGPADLVVDITSIDQGSNISDGAILAKDPNMAPVYLIDNGVKRWVTSQMAMDKFHFARDQVKLVPNIVLSYVPNGQDIT